MQVSLLSVFFVSLLGFGQSFVSPCCKIAKSGTKIASTAVRQRHYFLASSANEDGLDALDKEWQQYQQDRSNKQVSLSDFAKEDVLTPSSSEEKTSDSIQTANLGIFSLVVAIGCLLAAYFNGEAPIFVDTDTTTFEDVESAEGQFNALAEMCGFKQ